MDNGSAESERAARRVAPIVLGVLLAAFFIDALFTRSPEQLGVYSGLTIISLFLAATTGSLLIVSLIRGRPAWRLWAILLGATVGVWIAGALMFNYLPPIQL